MVKRMAWSSSGMNAVGTRTKTHAIAATSTA